MGVARILPAAVVLVLALASGAAAGEAAWTRFVESGDRALDQGRLVSAEELCVSAVAEAERVLAVQETVLGATRPDGASRIEARARERARPK
jgi:hypothetical protein